MFKEQLRIVKLGILRNNGVSRITIASFGTLWKLKKLKGDMYWDCWNRSDLTRAKAHDIGEVFDPDYSSPESDEDAKELFLQKQVFAMTILNRFV